MSSKIEQRLSRDGPKRVLSLDGGGVRGLISLGYLERIEAILAERSGLNDRFRLHQYFDLIGGTSTGAVIATLLGLGWRPAEIRTLYLTMLPSVFRPRRGVGRLLAGVGFRTKFDSAAFSAAIDEAFRAVAAQAEVVPERLTLDTDKLRTGLAIFAKRVDTGAVWVQTNNPRRKFWSPDNASFWPDGATFDPNAGYSLKTLVQASASAPYFVDPAPLRIARLSDGLFVDGGASPHNNPSKELFLLSTLREQRWAGTPQEPTPYGFGWSTGPDQLLMISVGTGYVRPSIDAREYRRAPEVKKAIHALRTIISDADLDAVTWMQAISRHQDPWRINSKLERMAGLRIVDAPLLTYQRYNQVIDRDALATLMGPAWARRRLSTDALERLREFDVAAADNLDALVEIGAAAAEQVKPGHLPPAFDDVLGRVDGV